jgi:hypothetical protein
MKRSHFLAQWYSAGRVTDVILLIRQTLRKHHGNIRQSARALDMSASNMELWLRRFELVDEAKEILQANRMKFRLFTDGQEDQRSIGVRAHHSDERHHGRPQGPSRDLEPGSTRRVDSSQESRHEQK